MLWKFHLTEAPEQPYDGRSLFDRLQEQKNKKDLDFEESRKMKNMIRGLDDDEVEYLSYVDQRKLTEERKKIEEEQQELKDFREKVATLQEQNIDTVGCIHFSEDKRMKIIIDCLFCRSYNKNSLHSPARRRLPRDSHRNPF